ncbi:MAG: lipocalin-like domain-containing protein [Sedimenticola sp.]|nr:lipocalin-like domain-containing protein [Sedimenticola sp.]
MGRLILILLLPLLVGCQQNAETTTEKLSATRLLSSIDQQGFSRANKARAFIFPQDHAAHPEYRNEWWYFTGNLQDQSGQRFGYQVTFFRFALKPPGKKPARSRWSNNQLWMAHAAVTDPEGGRHLKQEKLIREGPGLAGSDARPFRVWVEDWQLQQSQQGFPWTIQINADQFSIELEVEPTIGLILQGDKGLSQKSAAVGNASYYYSYPRLRSSGEITINEKRYQVTGNSWFDREWGTSTLSSEQTGWDWFSLQFNSGENLMFYHLRNQQGEADPFSAGTRIDKDATTKRLTLSDIEVTPLTWWQSPSGKRYPVEWEMKLKQENRTLQIKSILAGQEMDLSVRYWEGAVDIYEQGRSIGSGFLEMTGY